jgi:hypothetical protein
MIPLLLSAFVAALALRADWSITLATSALRSEPLKRIASRMRPAFCGKRPLAKGIKSGMISGKQRSKNGGNLVAEMTYTMLILLYLSHG